MNFLKLAATYGLLALTTGHAMEPTVSNKQPLPSLQPVQLADPVPVPESIGATVLAGVGFLILFRRRRYS